MVKRSKTKNGAELADEMVRMNVESRMGDFSPDVQEMLAGYSDDPYTQQYIMDAMEGDD